MTSHGKKRLAGLGVAVTAALVAGGWAQTASAASPEAGRDARAARALPAGRSPGKPRPPVEATLLQSQSLEAGVPASLVLELRARTGVEILDLQVEGSGGLSVVSVVPGAGTASPEPLVASQAAAEVAQWQIAATPTVGGTQNLSGLVTFRVNGVLQAAPFSLPVRVGGSEAPPATPRQKPAGALVTTPTGELIDSMPAETIVR